MKRLLLFSLLILPLAGTAWAQQPAPASAPPPGAPPGGAGQITITQQEWQELRAARAAALQANPGLQAKNAKLIEEMRALQDKIDAAMIKADPTIAPLLSRFEGGRPHPVSPAAAPPTTPSAK
ncbi:MAG TPA: hypothetical protein VL981_00910 [Candidatus Methylacidiphilales bacterium]|nr:hypothetical protein [Candidatus Methylacidiphilales bacterium]